MELTPLESDKLSDAAQGVLASDAMRMMAARGLAPIPDPVDLLSVLYQISVSPGDAGQADAKRTLAGLPESVVQGGLGDAKLNPRVLHFLHKDVTGQAVAAIVRNPSAADETIASIAATCPGDIVDLIATNEQRLLRAPEIIAQLYQNPKARMSVVDRLVELAIRNNVTVEGIAAWEELVNVYSGKGMENAKEVSPELDQDQLFAALSETIQKEQESESSPQKPPEEQEEPEEIPLRDMTVPMKIRAATLGNAYVRGQLVRDTVRMVALAAIKNPRVTDNEAAKYANNHSLSEDVIKFIARKRDWVKLYQIKLALVMNPKTPLATALRFLPHLRDKDKKNVAKSKNVPTALSAGAKKLMNVKKKRPGGGH